MTKLKTCLITGGAGFIGSHLCRRLLAMGVQIRIIDDLYTGCRDNIPPEITFIESSICDSKALHEAMCGCDTVFHLAARMQLQQTIVDPADCYQTNLVGTAQLVRCATELPNVFILFASSCSVYPLNPDGPLHEWMASNGETPYSLSKLSGEQTLRIYQTLRGLRSCSLRCFNVYGPGQKVDSQYASVVPIFLRQALAGTPMTVYGSGEQSRDFIHVEDVVAAYVSAANRRVCGTFNIATGIGCSINELAATISRLTGGAPVEHLPARKGDASASIAEVAAARGTLGFSATISLELGLRNYIKHLQRTEFTN